MPIRAIYSGASGMVAQQTGADNAANNIANANTPGYQRGEVSFQDMLLESLQASGAGVPTGIQVGNGVRVSAIDKVFTQGPLLNTGNPFDVAIEGQGFFQIRNPIDGGLRYSRDGGFRLDATGRIVTSAGFPLEPAITVPPEALAVSMGLDGTVSATLPGTVAPTALGQMLLARFINPAGLSAEGGNLFSETGGSGAPLVSTPGIGGTGLLRQGFLEMSNVELVNEAVGLLLARRAFAANSKPIRTSDDMLSITNNLVR